MPASLLIFQGDVMRESAYQTKLIKKLETMFPGCVIQRGDPQRRQGIPDITILYGKRWAALELKIDSKASVRPNQPFYVEKLNKMSFAAFIYPENEEEVLRELQLALKPRRAALVS